MLCTHFGAGSGFACAILKPCTSSQIVLCTQFGTGSRFACGILKPCTSNRAVYTLFKLSHRKHSPGINYVADIVNFLGYCCPECPRSQTLSWRFFRRRHSPGDSLWIYPWILLSRVSSIANTFLVVLPSQTLSWSPSLDLLGYCCPECPRSQTFCWRLFRRISTTGRLAECLGYWNNRLLSLSTTGTTASRVCLHGFQPHFASTKFMIIYFFCPDAYFMLMLFPSGRIAYIDRFGIRTHS